MVRVFWLHDGLLPLFGVSMGYESPTSCGWLGAMLDALLKVDDKVEFCLLGRDSRPCDSKVGCVRQVSFGIKGRGWYRKCPKILQDRASELIRQFDPEVIHIHGTEYFFGNLGGNVFGDRPVVVSLQGIISECAQCYEGGLTWQDLWRAHLGNIRFWLKGVSTFRTKRVWETARSRQEAEIFSKNRFVIGRTEWDRKLAREKNPSARYYVVNENLRTPFYGVLRSRSKIRRHSIYCGAAAGYPLKGAHWLLRAIALLKSEFSDISLHIAAARDFIHPSLDNRIHEEPYAAYMRQLMKQLGLSDCVVALPPLSPEQVVAELCQAELFVLPSMCENSPNSLCEAMIVGTPAIATNVGGIPSLLRNGVEGKLVPAGNAEALAEAIRWCFLHPEEAEACARVARETALRRHDPLRNARTLMDVYRQVIKEVGLSAREKA